MDLDNIFYQTTNNQSTTSVEPSASFLNVNILINFPFPSEENELIPNIQVKLNENNEIEFDSIIQFLHKEQFNFNNF